MAYLRHFQSVDQAELIWDNKVILLTQYHAVFTRLPLTITISVIGGRSASQGRSYFQCVQGGFISCTQVAQWCEFLFLHWSVWWAFTLRKIQKGFLLLKPYCWNLEGFAGRWVGFPGCCSGPLSFRHFEFWAIFWGEAVLGLVVQCPHVLWCTFLIVPLWYLTIPCIVPLKTSGVLQ